MAKETPKHEEHGAKPKGGKPRHHLHEIRSTQAEDGSIVHHHTYKENPDAPHTMPERGPMATSSTPEEAGQHVSEMFGANGIGGGQGAGGEEEGAGGEPEEA